MIIALVSIYIITALWAIFSILLYGNRPARSISWLFIVIFFPFLGVFFFVIFGVNRKKFKFFTLNFNAKRKLYEFNYDNDNIQEFTRKEHSANYEKIDNLMSKSSGFPTVKGNKIDLLKDGETTFDALFKSFRNAKKFIHIQYYILGEGQLLDEIIEIFTEKIKEGVEVRILYDAVGSYSWKNKSIKKLKKIGADVYPILPLNVSSILSTINYRNHRKIAIIDGYIAFCGGVNVSDKYIEEESELGIWDDTHLKIQGPAVGQLHRIFIKDYYFASNEFSLCDEKYLPRLEQKGDVLLQVIAGGPDFDYLSILHQYLMMISCAENSIYIENPYFIPNKALLEALKMSVLGGIDVHIMVPKSNDSWLAKHSMFANFEDLLMAGVKIYVYKETFSHSKLMIVDNEIASVGSGNFDFRSFEYNYEVNTLIYDKDLAQELTDDFKKNIENCNILDYETFKQRSIFTKLVEGYAKIFSPLL